MFGGYKCNCRWVSFCIPFAFFCFWLPFKSNWNRNAIIIPVEFWYRTIFFFFLVGFVMMVFEFIILVFIFSFSVFYKIIAIIVYWFDPFFSLVSFMPMKKLLISVCELSYLFFYFYLSIDSEKQRPPIWHDIIVISFVIIRMLLINNKYVLYY